jgi:hypothetical protein
VHSALHVYCLRNLVYTFCSFLNLLSVSTMSSSSLSRKNKRSALMQAPNSLSFSRKRFEKESLLMIVTCTPQNYYFHERLDTLYFIFPCSKVMFVNLYLDIKTTCIQLYMYKLNSSSCGDY